MELYERTAQHAKNNECFRQLAKRYPWIKFTQPQPVKAPWHWQCIIRGEGPYPVLVNFWPHVAKAQREHCKSVQGWEDIRLIIVKAIDENGFDDDGEVTE